MLYLCTRNQGNRLHFRSGSLQCGNSSVGRAQPCQGWGREFESRFPLQKPEKVEIFSRPFSFLPFGICYLSPKPPFCKGGGFWSGKRGLHERPQDAPFQGVRGCKYSSREMPANAGSWLVFRSKSKSFEDKIKQNPLKHRFRGFFICCRPVSFRHRGAPTRHSPNLEVSLRISTVKIRDTYSEMRGHFDNFSAFHKLFRLTVAYALIKTVR